MLDPKIFLSNKSTLLLKMTANTAVFIPTSIYRALVTAVIILIAWNNEVKEEITMVGRSGLILIFPGMVIGVLYCVLTNTIHMSSNNN